MNKENDEKFRKGASSFMRFLKNYQYVLIVLAVGLILLCLPTNSGGTEQAAGDEPDGAAPTFSLEEQEAKIASALSKIKGAGTVTVVLSLKTSMEQEVAIDADSNGNKETVTVSTGTGTQSPVTIRYIYPVYQGALIVAEGAENPGIKLAITEAVAALTGLGTDKISVFGA